MMSIEKMPMTCCPKFYPHTQHSGQLQSTTRNVSFHPILVLHTVCDKFNFSACLIAADTDRRQEEIQILLHFNAKETD